jgi:hypothetical protein
MGLMYRLKRDGSTAHRRIDRGGEYFPGFRGGGVDQARRTVFNEEGVMVRVDPLMRWSRERFLLRAPNRHIQPESTFWRRVCGRRLAGVWTRIGDMRATLSCGCDSSGTRNCIQWTR